MKRILIALLLLFLAVYGGILLSRHSGYVLFVYQPWTVEMPLWLFFVLTIVSFIIFHSLVNAIYYGTSIPQKLRDWFIKREHQRAAVFSERGLIAFAEGKWALAEKYLLKSIHLNSAPFINFLIAANAAQEQQAYVRRDEYLRRAHQVNQRADIAIELTQAKLQIHQGQFEQAIATLNHLREKVPYHPYVLKLLQQVYLELEDWKNLMDLIPSLKKAKVLSKQQALDLRYGIEKKI